MDQTSTATDSQRPAEDRSPATDFSRWRRNRMRVSRVALFCIVGLGFGTGPLVNEMVLKAAPDILALLTIVELGLVAPLMALAALFSWRGRPQVLAQAMQMAAVMTAVGSALLFRSLALEGQMAYPSQMSGLIVIAMAMFGGFNWRRMALLSLSYLVLSASLELSYARSVQEGLLQAYAAFYMALIAFGGAAMHEYLMRNIWSDLNRLRQTRAALRHSESRFNAFMNHSPFIAWIKDADRRYVYRNKRHSDRYGTPGEDWTGRTDGDFFPGVSAHTYQETDERVLRSGQPVEFETVNISRDGSPNRWWIQKFPIRDEQGRYMVGGIGIDISERRKLEEKLRESESRFQIFMDQSPSVAWMKDEDGHLVYANRALREFLGISADAWPGTTDFDYFPEDVARKSRELDLRTLTEGNAIEAEGVMSDASGARRHWLLVRFPFNGPSGKRYIGGVATDLTERKRAEELVRLQSLTDELTGLYNRRGFALLAEQEMKTARSRGDRCALLYVDLDRLKRINQDHGHAGGDAAIVAAAEALRVAARRSDIVARVGGDEFVIFAAGLEDAEKFQRGIAEAIAGYGNSDELPFALSATVGVAEFDPADGRSLEQHMLLADEMMFGRKQSRP